MEGKGVAGAGGSKDGTCGALRVGQVSRAQVTGVQPRL